LNEPEERSLLRIAHEIDEDPNGGVDEVAILGFQQVDDRRELAVSRNVLVRRKKRF
jgi:hypothetical protein